MTLKMPSLQMKGISPLVLFVLCIPRNVKRSFVFHSERAATRMKYATRSALFKKKKTLLFTLSSTLKVNRFDVPHL